MKWYIVQFDKSWVKCRNFKCRAEYFKDSVKSKRKCPSCKMNSRGIIIETSKK